MTSVNNINYFFFYEKTKQILEKTLKLKESSFNNNKNNKNKIQQDESKYYAQNNKNALFYFLSALIARGITTSITLPLEYLRMLEIGSQKNNQVSSLFKNLKNLSFKERFRSLFSGYKITMQRDLSFSGIYWALVEKTRYNLDQLINSRLVENEVERILLINTVTGMLCGSVTSVLTLPLDNLKTRIQLEKKKKNDLLEGRKTSNSTIKQLYRMEQQEGFKSLFVGIGPRITKAASHCAIYLSLYEIFLNVLQKKDCFY
ncbi:Mitochondrial carrier domain [Pseudocohnilembus persalinus]|uniref:Mitochondrial carrier domain n=1 Tax=Pseudocohnilembus persalinus TaxID=266149 RepID=A0A0V0QXF0_PSEPJ|nr:Mitochondrial carrier domain [Pseudocohnilembus persalinus]|eukprot:KRX07075.1 Mitochondrial carrier domain [Pseudocohnilembus persalinus]